MRLSLWLVLSAVVVAFSGVSRADDTADFLKPENWHGLEKYWKVEGTTVKGVCTEDPKFNTFLCSKKEYSDFELSFKVKMTGAKANSGIQVRSKIVNAEKFVVHGPQCDMGQIFWGSLYGEGVGGMMKACAGDFVKKHVKEGEFNDYFLCVKGNKFTIKVNGEVSVDAEFPTTPNKKETDKAGIIAFQLHQGGAMTVEFKDIKFVNLAK
ncbi:MAG: 3-keto-disaccharide hydrolase [Fimbriiglobus sp.]